MSQENLERLSRGLDAVAGRDKAAWDELCDPNLEVVPVGDWPEGEIQGREAAWDFFIAADEPWEPGTYEVVEFIDGGDQGVAHLRRDMKGKSSGVEVHYDYWLVATLRDGKTRRLEWFEKRDEALDAAGLRE
jgi:ketosteroid isomerase-like protein